MALNFPEILAIVHELKPLEGNFYFKECLQADQKTILLVLESHSITQRVLFCFQSPCVRFHLTKKEGYAGHTPFEKSLNNYLKNSLLKAVTVLNQDRIVCVEFIKAQKSYLFVVELFSKSPNGYFLNENWEILSTFFPVEQQKYTLPENRFDQNNIPALTNSELIEKEYQRKEADLLYTKQKNCVINFINKKIKSQGKKLDQLKKQLSVCEQWETEFNKAQLLQSNLYKIKPGDRCVEVDDWLQGITRVIDLDPLKKPATEIADTFKKSQKLKKGIDFVKVQIGKVNRLLNFWKEQHGVLGVVKNQDELAYFCQTNKVPLDKKKPQEGIAKNVKTISLPYKKFKSHSGLIIWVGKSAKDNEMMTFHFARGSDLWLHVSHYAGSHVIIKSEKNQEIDERSLQEACQLALYYSKAKHLHSAEVLITQQKFLKRASKHQKGGVYVANGKRRLIVKDDLMIRAIMERQPSTP